MLAKQMQISVHVQPVIPGMQLKALRVNDLLVSSQCYFILSHCLFKHLGATCFANTSQLKHYKRTFIVARSDAFIQNCSTNMYRRKWIIKTASSVRIGVDLACGYGH